MHLFMKTSLFLLLSCGWMLKASAQIPVTALDSTLNHFAAACMPERVYIHYDKPVYNAGETIWEISENREIHKLNILA